MFRTKNFLLLILSLIFSSSYSAQDKNCDCSVLLIPKGTEIPIYEKSSKNVLLKIKNDTIKEDYCLIQIKEIKEDWANIMVRTVSDTVEKNGWINKKYLGIYPNPYFGDTVKLFVKTDTLSSIKSTIVKPEFFLANILQCKNKWLYIKYLDADKKMKEAWLSPDNQCSNPYTTCN